MADVFTPAKRSAVMALIRGSGNKATELRMIALFRAHGSPAGGANRSSSANPTLSFAASGSPSLSMDVSGTAVRLVGREARTKSHPRSPRDKNFSEGRLEGCPGLGM
jgi:hypothetical protein